MMPLPVLYIHTCALSAHTRVRVYIFASTTHLLLAATPLSLPGAVTVYSDIFGLILLHVILGEQLVSETLYGTGSLKDHL
jgi:hypothetical protein